MEATLYKQTGESVKVTPKNGVHFTLDELQGYVAGYIEIIRLNEGEIMVINEDGKFIKGATLNRAATDIAARNSAIWGHDYIVGHALVCQNSMVK